MQSKENDRKTERKILNWTLQVINRPNDRANTGTPFISPMDQNVPVGPNHHHHSGNIGGKDRILESSSVCVCLDVSRGERMLIRKKLILKKLWQMVV